MARRFVTASPKELFQAQLNASGLTDIGRKKPEAAMRSLVELVRNPRREKPRRRLTEGQVGMKLVAKARGWAR